MTVGWQYRGAKVSKTFFCIILISCLCCKLENNYPKHKSFLIAVLHEIDRMYLVFLNREATFLKGYQIKFYMVMV